MKLVAVVSCVLEVMLATTLFCAPLTQITSPTWKSVVKVDPVPVTVPEPFVTATVPLRLGETSNPLAPVEAVLKVVELVWIISNVSS